MPVKAKLVYYFMDPTAICGFFALVLRIKRQLPLNSFVKHGRKNDHRNQTKKVRGVSELKEEVPMNNIAFWLQQRCPNPWRALQSQAPKSLIFAILETSIVIRESAKVSHAWNLKLQLKKMQNRFRKKRQKPG